MRNHILWLTFQQPQGPDAFARVFANKMWRERECAGQSVCGHLPAVLLRYASDIVQFCIPVQEICSHFGHVLEVGMGPKMWWETSPLCCGNARPVAPYGCSGAGRRRPHPRIATLWRCRASRIRVWRLWSASLGQVAAHGDFVASPDATKSPCADRDAFSLLRSGYVRMKGISPATESPYLEGSPSRPLRIDHMRTEGQSLRYEVGLRGSVPEILARGCEVR